MSIKHVAVVMAVFFLATGGSIIANPDSDVGSVEMARVSTGDVLTPQTGVIVEVPIVVSTINSISGMQISLKYNTESMTPGTPATTPRTAGMSVAHNVDSGRIVILMYDVSGKTIEPGNGPVLILPFTLSQDVRGKSELVFQEVILADAEAQAIPVEMISAPVSLERNLPTTFALSQNYPNPFNPETVIDFQIPEASHVTLAIFNVLGQEIRRLVDEQKDRGYFKIGWDGKNDFGESVTSGIYFYSLKTGDFKSIKKMMMLK